MNQRFRKFINSILVIFFCSTLTFSQIRNSRTKISEIIELAKGHIGVAIMDLDSHDTLTFNNNYCYPMQSVFKFPVALAALNKVDRGILAFDQKIHITKEELLPNTWSPLQKKYPDGNVDITLRELLKYTVSESDNNGCDILFRLLGGPAKVNEYIRSLGIKGISIAATEEDIHKDWDVQYKNCSTPSAMLNLFYKFDHNNILSNNSKDFLWSLMARNIFGAKRIMGELPEGTMVVHKTGSSGENDKGIAAATNDSGIVVLPNGKRFAIIVFISDSPDYENNRDKVIAEIAKAVWDSYVTN